MSGEAQLEALLEIINSSARQAIAEYKKGGNEVPTIYSRTYHPLDHENDTVALRKAVRLLSGACEQLCVSLAPPQQTIYNYVLSFDRTCVDVVLRAKVADMLENLPEGLHVDELAKRVNLERGKLARILRLLATKGCFTEVALDTFANNRISLVTLSSSSPGATLRYLANSFIHLDDVMYEAMTKPEYAASDGQNNAPIFHAVRKRGFKGSYIDWVRADADKNGANFHPAMIGQGSIMGSLSVLYHYPWDEVKTVCDVGSSIGTFSQPLARAHPHLNIIDQDLPQVLDQAKQIWARDAPEVLERNQVKFVPLNFLEQGPVQGQDVYYLRNIIHDWPDAEVAIILRNIRNAMAPHSRLLIQDYVVVSASSDSSATSFGLDTAPEPLLPNFGNGGIRAYQQDLNMWFLCNGKERSADELVTLGHAADLQLKRVYDLGEAPVVEFRVAA